MSEKKLVLIVDDSARQRQFVEEGVRGYLDPDEWDVVTASSEEEGRAKFDDHRAAVAVAVVDVCLSLSDTKQEGVDLIRWIAQRKPECFRIMVSGFFRDRSQLPPDAPMHAFIHTRLQKGYNPVTELEVALGRALDQMTPAGPPAVVRMASGVSQ